jgi:hypothetical protein
MGEVSVSPSGAFLDVEGAPLERAVRNGSFGGQP